MKLLWVSIEQDLYSFPTNSSMANIGILKQLLISFSVLFYLAGVTADYWTSYFEYTHNFPIAFRWKSCIAH